jgi:ASCH domain
MKALSIRQPWAWLILHAGKDIENRNWQPRNPGLRFRGTCLIHAGIALQPISDELRVWVKQSSGVDLPRSDELPRGGIVGQVDVIDVVRASSSPWFEGPCGLVLANPKPLPFAPSQGKLGFFRAPLQLVADPLSAPCTPGRRL